MSLYLDTSAMFKLAFAEAESDALGDYLGTSIMRGHDLVTSMLLLTELNCAVERRGVRDAPVTELLDTVTLVDLIRADLNRAATSRWGLRSSDAIHLAVALRLNVDVLVAYDIELLAGADRVGLVTASPGRPIPSPRDDLSG